MPTLDFYRDRADEARLAAGTTTLENVRARHLRSAAAWEEMADRAARTVRHREAAPSGVARRLQVALGPARVVGLGARLREPGRGALLRLFAKLEHLLEGKAERVHRSGAPVASAASAASRSSVSA